MEKSAQKIELWMEQLRRMREMQYAYHKKFFHGLYFDPVDAPRSVASCPPLPSASLASSPCTGLFSGSA
jgi:hypothetical protein